MDTSKYDESLKREVYSKAMKLRDARMNRELIYVRLEKQGYPEDLIKEVLINMGLQQRKEMEQAKELDYKIAGLKIGLAIVVTLGVGYFFPGTIILPIGLLISGIILAVTTSTR